MRKNRTLMGSLVVAAAAAGVGMAQAVDMPMIIESKPAWAYQPVFDRPKFKSPCRRRLNRGW